MKNYQTFLSQGASIAGSAVGAAVGALITPSGTMAGTAVGAVIGETCKIVLDDVAQRFLSPKESQRVAGVAALAIEKIRDELLWRERRGDAFFTELNEGPSPAEEVFEGVLLAAKNEHEQLKLSFIANFYANLVFEPYIDKAEANYLLAIAEGLTYRQFCLLQLINCISSFKTRSEPWSRQNPMHPESHIISVEALALYQKSLVGRFSQQGEMGTANVYHPGLVVPAASMITGVGIKLCSLLGLHAIEKAHLEALAQVW
ncbi:hypothetical protein [Pseudomonas sp. URMO17WK12:I11]|uniref:hypothetical protein n=1 Tax=Pseudomonas sp. URMO17WK12:I11 TaxID=1283291 RepID=UPI00119E1F46|nr:hypothetical protein [Pseudomonas sp. URMO17WK12:I11]